MKRGIAFVSGLLFGGGLLLSGMTSPRKVLGFLDIAGAWDPSLAFVMGAGLLVATPLFTLARLRGKALNGTELNHHPNRTIDARLVAGAALFGLGWGLVGLCPGPALVDLTLSPMRASIFVGMMALGLLATRRG